jgi:hypothetical protein
MFRSSRRKGLLAAAVLTLVVGSGAFAQRSDAADFHLGLGANYWLVERAVFNLDISVTFGVASYLSVGGRFGGLITTAPAAAGIPLDLLLHVALGSSRLYLEGVAGPWLLFEGDVLRAHAGIGFGITAGPLSFGAEVGYLDPRAMVGGRLMFRL